MKMRLPGFLKRFGKEEDGQIFVEFILSVPVFIGLMLISVELGMFTFKQVMLDRGLDIAVRQIRLGTGQNLTHGQVKATICQNAGFLTDCQDTLRLEMLPINPRQFGAGFRAGADCVDVSQPVTPLRAFVHGNNHQLMILRACYMFKPVFPTTGMGQAYTKDGSGRAKMFSMAAFVQEPGN